MKDPKCNSCEEYKKDWIRALADYDNLKKDIEKSRKMEKAKMIDEALELFLPAMDRLDELLLTEIVKNKDIVKGLKIIHGQFKGLFKKFKSESLYDLLK